jgi:hypothetical protein
LELVGFVLAPVPARALASTNAVTIKPPEIRRMAFSFPHLTLAIEQNASCLTVQKTIWASAAVSRPPRSPKKPHASSIDLTTATGPAPAA